MSDWQRIERDVTEIQRLLREAYDHYFATGDGYCKPHEGAVSLDFPTYFEFRDGREIEPSVSVYSYVLGPFRNHHFANTGEALATVRQWHAREMARPAEDA